jgi:peroxiredoxin
MRIPRLFPALSLLSLTALAQPPTPRKAPEITIVEPSGKQTLLSSYRGKVVALAFVSTACSHCQAECQVLTKLQGELGSKGFQPLAVAFIESTPPQVSNFVNSFHITFPVGYAVRQTVLDYLQYTDTDAGWKIPQIVLIDRKGMIVEQSNPQGSPDLQEEASLRKKITDLLAAGAKKKSGH